jgi:hypothetical protein
VREFRGRSRRCAAILRRISASLGRAVAMNVTDSKLVASCGGSSSCRYAPHPRQALSLVCELQTSPSSHSGREMRRNLFTRNAEIEQTAHRPSRRGRVEQSRCLVGLLTCGSSSPKLPSRGIPSGNCVVSALHAYKVAGPCRIHTGFPNSKNQTGCLYRERIELVKSGCAEVVH